MHKKRLTGIILIIGLVGFGLILRYLLNPLNNPRVAYDLKKGDVFELKQDIILYASLPPVKEHRWMEPRTYYSYKFDKLKEHPNQEIIENNYVIRIVPKGTLIKFTRIGKEYNWTSGAHFVYNGMIISGEQASEAEVSLYKLLFDRENKRTNQYLFKKREPL